MIGKRFSPILEEIEDGLWKFDCEELGQPHYTKEGFRAAIKIFMSAMQDKAYDLQIEEGIETEDGIKMMEKMAKDIKKLVKTYTGVDTTKMYE